MEEYKKKIQKKLVIMRIIGILLLLVIIAEKTFLEKNAPVYAGLLGGIAVGMLPITIGYCVRFSNALKDEKKLKEMYIQQTDERNKEIIKETMQTSFFIAFFVTVLAILISAAFSKIVAMTLEISIVVYSLIFAGVSAYYNKKL
ncbi:MAG: hypothetical protein MJ100_01505 [Ruminococcus sp.]|nr:hypothetical protein [Ruminococcus sp.]